MELSNFKSNPTIEFQIVHPIPEKNPTGFFITVASQEHPNVRAALATVVDRRVAEYHRSGSMKPPTFEEKEADDMETLVASVISWRGLTEGGVDVSCTPETVRNVLTSSRTIREQVQNTARNEALFFES